MLKRILIGIAVIVAAFAAFVATRPSTYKVERSLVVDAPPAAVFQRVVDFRKWEGWSPWAKLDPNMKVDFAGPESGVGAIYHWKGNDKVGEGRMTITGASADRLIQVKLEFLKPWAQTSLTQFTFAPDPGGTKVTWTMSGEHDFVGKLFAVFMDMDGMVGPDFEKGLKALKERARD
jgi:uncharacterized protein YndB with AHSA1/START domain